MQVGFSSACTMFSGLAVVVFFILCVGWMLDLSLFDGRSLAMQIQGKDMMILCCANSFAIYWEVGIGRNARILVVGQWIMIYFGRKCFFLPFFLGSCIGNFSKSEFVNLYRDWWCFTNDWMFSFPLICFVLGGLLVLYMHCVKGLSLFHICGS